MATNALGSRRKRAKIGPGTFEWPEMVWEASGWPEMVWEVSKWPALLEGFSLSGRRFWRSFSGLLLWRV